MALTLYPQCERRQARRGGTIVECLMAITLIGMALGLTAQGLGLLAAQRRIIERRSAALLELDQVLERVAIAPWEQLNAAEIEKLELSEFCRLRVPGSRLAAEVTDEPGTPAARRISVTLRWQTVSGSEETSPALVAWRYQAAEALP